MKLGTEKSSQQTAGTTSQQSQWFHRGMRKILQGQQEGKSSQQKRYGRRADQRTEQHRLDRMRQMFSGRVIFRIAYG